MSADFEPVPPAVAALREGALPRLRDRLQLGRSGLSVSPVCLGLVGSPQVVSAAFSAGINFFFLTADMHWPVYEAVRQGLRELLQASLGAREQLVVAVASYVTQPEFCELPFLEVLEAVPELRYIDVAVIGGSYSSDFLTRRQRYTRERQDGARGLGATFHERALAATAVNHRLVDVAFIRYNSAHAGAEQDVFPRLTAARGDTRLFGFQSTHGYVPPARLAELGVPSRNWRPAITDHYRLAFSNARIDGILCSLETEQHVVELERALARGALSRDEVAYLKSLSELHVGLVEMVPGAEAASDVDEAR